jgi:Fe-S-cluster-containing dehydrogenase component/DMSO reductase anchor subunit
VTASASEALVGPQPKAAEAKKRLPVLPVAALLESQRTLTAVERFSRAHDACEVPRQARYYRDLIPLERPKPGQQYGFEVDLDACTGCKACVAACHTLNGLDSGEVWRTVGLLHGGTPKAPALQTVTTSCHHCLEPACMLGCPVQAYEKDPVTGIVKHLDDQCFGCQYCTLMCPYDAPKYNKAKGIVRKCDMCSDRLAHGEAPACVQACPNEAIAIRIVEQSATVEAADAHAFLPGAPAPDHTLPTTVYKTAKPMPSNMLPADFYSTSPEHSHLPLVIMLVLMQLSTGAFALNFVVERVWGHPAGDPLWQAGFAAALAGVALFASVFHLGRPHLFYRAFLGLRTSWMSREAVAFGVFAKLAFAYAALSAAYLVPDFPHKSLIVERAPEVHLAAAIVGALGVFFSVMVYVATRREQWSGTHTGVRFFGTMVGLGAAAVLLVQAYTALQGELLSRESKVLLGLVLAASIVKLAREGWVLWHRHDKRRSIEKRMAFVMLGDLARVTGARFLCGLLGGIVLPAWLLGNGMTHSLQPVSAALLALLLAGEFSERYLFFRAAPASRMPGGLP